MAQYAMLIYVPKTGDARTTDSGERAEHDRHAHELEDSGAMVAVFALQPSATATSIRGGMVTDGPFIESKEVIAGIAIIEAADLEAAVAIARGNPAIRQGGGVEVRPVEDGAVLARAMPG
jgi:hypothetical protein